MDSSTIKPTSFNNKPTSDDAVSDKNNSSQTDDVTKPTDQTHQPPSAAPAAPPPGPPPIDLEKTTPQVIEKPDPIPLQNNDQEHLGVGTPNIGVEREDQQSVKPPAQSPPVTSQPSPATNKLNQTPPIMAATENMPPKKEDKVEIADYEAYPTTQAPNKSQLPPTGQNASPQDSPITVKNYQNPNLTNTSRPPIPATAGVGGKLVAIIILALLIGGAGGFFGFKYYDKLKLNASTEETTSSSDTTEEPSTDVSKWNIYNSSIYTFSLKYPNGWFSSTDSKDAESIIFASNETSLTAKPTGYKIEVNFQSSNDQTLKKWVEANAASTGENGKIKEITVSGQVAYQQELTKNGPEVATFIERPEKIMVVTYSAPEDLFSIGGDWYNGVINSIKLL